MKKLLIALTLMTSISSYGETIEKNINIEFPDMCWQTHVSTDVDLTFALAKIGIDAYNVSCDDNNELSLSVIYNEDDIPTNTEISILEENNDGYFRFYPEATEETITRILFSLGYSSKFKNVLKKGKSNKLSRFLNEINPLNIPGVIFPGMFGVRSGKKAESDKIIGQTILVKRFRNN